MRQILTGIVLLMLALPAQAEVPLSGTFTATMACPAYQSINRQTNPGPMMTEPGQAYELVAGNKALPSHYWIVMPGAEPNRRWVAVECGTTDSEVQVEAAEPISPPAYRGTQSGLERHEWTKHGTCYGTSAEE